MIQIIYYKNYKIHVNVEGEGEPVIFLHGWPTNASLWTAQRNFLKANYQVITPDWLGFGQSDKPKDHQYSLMSMVEILDVLVSELLPPNQKFTIISHDIGGPVSVLWVNEHQERVSNLIILNTLFYNFRTPLDKLGHFIFGLPFINRIQLSDIGLSSLIMNLLKNKKEDKLKVACEIFKSHENWSVELRRKTIMEPLDKEGRMLVNDLASTFKALDIRKYFIIARKDPLCYAHMQRVHEENPEVPAYFLDKCGHFIPIDCPDELNDTLLKILTVSEEKGIDSKVRTHKYR